MQIGLFCQRKFTLRILLTLSHIYIIIPFSVSRSNGPIGLHVGHGISRFLLCSLHRNIYRPTSKSFPNPCNRYSLISPDAITTFRCTVFSGISKRSRRCLKPYSSHQPSHTLPVSRATLFPSEAAGGSRIQHYSRGPMGGLASDQPELHFYLVDRCPFERPAFSRCKMEISAAYTLYLQPHPLISTTLHPQLLCVS